MINILVDSLILFLLIYALLDIFTRTSDYFMNRVFVRNIPAAYHVFLLNSEPENIEYDIRRLLHNMLDYDCEVLVVDMNNHMENHWILEQLCLEYEFLHHFTKEEYIAFIQDGNLHFTEKFSDISSEHK